jgi:hypothetical protein
LRITATSTRLAAAGRCARLASHHAVAHVEQPIPYYNSGCWTELPCTYLTVADGIVRLHDFSEAVTIPAPVSVSLHLAPA